jgi:NAD(P)H-hydrate epimerase
VIGKWSGFEHKLIAIYQPQNKCRIFRRNPVFELLTPSEMAECDRATIAAGTPGILLMERAGAAVARAAVEMTAGPAIVVLAGPGNNGGDGFVAARILRDRGYRITVLLHGERSALRGDAAEASRRFDGIVQPARPDGFARADLIVDALYGAGVRLPLHKDAVRLIEAVNASAAFVLAVDLPSGVEGEGGRVDGRGIFCFRAARSAGLSRSPTSASAPMR